jgi:hypothetical protein
MSTMPAARAQIFARVIVLAGLALACAPTAAAAQLPMGDGAFSDPVVTSYRLTSAKLDPFLAAVHALDALGDTDGTRPLDNMAEDADLSEIVAALDSEPRVRAALEGAGLSSQEYTTFMLALVRAMFGSLAFEMGGDEALEEMDDDVLRENVRFYIANQDIFDRLGEDGT